MSLSSELRKEESWYRQVKNDMACSKRKIDQFSMKDVYLMYKNKQFVCDSCGNKLEKISDKIEDHIFHLMDPVCFWICEDCFQHDLKNNNIIAMEEEKAYDWQSLMR